MTRYRDECNKESTLPAINSHTITKLFLLETIFYFSYLSLMHACIHGISLMGFCNKINTKYAKNPKHKHHIRFFLQSIILIEREFVNLLQLQRLQETHH